MLPKLVLMVSLLSGFTLLPVRGWSQTTAAESDEAVAKSAAERANRVWLALVDAARWGESWKAASVAFQKAVPEETWVGGVARVREPLGTVLHRKLLRSTFSRELPGAPDGQYVVSQYRTSFANKPEAVETVVAQVDGDGSWRISGYYVK